MENKLSDKTERLRLSLSAIVSDTMGKESGELFYKFHLDDDAESLADGFKALLEVILGPELTKRKLDKAKKG